MHEVDFGSGIPISDDNTIKYSALDFFGSGRLAVRQSTEWNSFFFEDVISDNFLCVFFSFFESKTVIPQQ